jgi:hypothetical protein
VELLGAVVVVVVVPLLGTVLGFQVVLVSGSP